jgi:hypothetical protein
MFTKQHVVIVSAATQDYLSDPHCQPATVLRLSDRIEKCKGGDDRWIKKTQPQSRVIFSTRTRPGSRLTISSTSGSQLRVPGRGHGTAGLHSHLSKCVHASSSSFLTRSCKGVWTKGDALLGHGRRRLAKLRAPAARLAASIYLLVSSRRSIVAVMATVASTQSRARWVTRMRRWDSVQRLWWCSRNHGLSFEEQCVALQTVTAENTGNSTQSLFDHEGCSFFDKNLLSKFL